MLCFYKGMCREKGTNGTTNEVNGLDVRVCRAWCVQAMTIVVVWGGK